MPSRTRPTQRRARSVRWSARCSSTRSRRLIKKGIDEGATLVTGGLGRPEGLNRGYYVRPTVFANVTNDMTIAREEIFGPVLAMLPYDTEDDAIRMANDTVYGLSGYVQSGDLAHARKVASQLRTGNVHLNGAGADFSAPFGGYKQSGHGPRMGRAWLRGIPRDQGRPRLRAEGRIVHFTRTLSPRRGRGNAVTTFEQSVRLFRAPLSLARRCPNLDQGARGQRMRKVPGSASLIALVLAFPTAASAFVPVAVPQATPAAIALTRTHEVLWIAAQLMGLIVPALLLFTGLGARLRSSCSRLVRGNRYGTLTVFAIAYLVIAAACVMPIDYWRDVVTEQNFGRAGSAPAPWLVAELAPLIVKAVCAALFLWIPYTLIRRSPRRWWLYGAVALVPVAFLVLVALPVFVDPLTTDYKPLVDKVLGAKIEALAARCGVPAMPIFVGGDDDTVVGLGPTNRIILEADIGKHETAGSGHRHDRARTQALRDG